MDLIGNSQDINRIGTKYNKLIGILDGIIRYDHWMVSFPKSGVFCRPFLAGAFFFGFFHQLWSLLSTIPRRGVFFFFCLRHILKNAHIWSTKVISGPDFLKNDDIWSDFIHQWIE